MMERTGHCCITVDNVCVGEDWALLYNCVGNVCVEEDWALLYNCVGNVCVGED